MEKHCELRKKYFEESQKAFEAGDKAKAKELSEKGKKEDAKVKALQDKAAKKIFRTKNKKNPIHTIDLHGLQVAPAIRIVEERYQLLTTSHKDEKAFTVIPGAGGCYFFLSLDSFCIILFCSRFHLHFIWTFSIFSLF